MSSKTLISDQNQLKLDLQIRPIVKHKTIKGLNKTLKAPCSIINYTTQTK